MTDLSEHSGPGPKDVFLHLLSIGMLYASVISFLVLVFQYINHLFPDVLTYSYGADLDAIRFSTAALVIVFPVYLLTNWLLLLDIRLMPVKATIWVRRWLLHFTLFLASVVIIVDLVTLVFNFLNGDLTTRFLLKVLAVFFVAAVVFWYYLWDLRRSTAPSAKPRIFGFISAVVVFMTVVVGFFITGSPFQQRAIRFDQQRVSDLQSIQDEIINFWQLKRVLPSPLATVENDINGFTLPVDPASRTSYDYTVLSKLSFQLCATFDAKTPQEPEGPPVGANQTWTHGIGHTCFQRTIDPQLYPPPTSVPSVP
jgi:hypothetical protein